MAKRLTADQVREARTRFYQHGEDIATLARVFNVSRSAMADAVYGRTWKNLPLTYRRPTTPDPKGT